jgi:hypothetical protein
MLINGECTYVALRGLTVTPVMVVLGQIHKL